MNRHFLRTAILFLLLLPLAIAGSAFAQDRAAIEKIVEEYIRSHPEVVMESLQRYQAEQKRAQEEAALQERVDVSIGDAPSIGPKNAPITLIEFSDFQCPYCARSFDTVEELSKRYKGKIRLVFKHNPLPFHKKARPAHKASIAAQRQGKFWSYRNLLMTHQGEWSGGDTDAVLKKYASEAGLDMSRFVKDMADPKLDAIIDADLAQAQEIGVQGTPTYIVNGAFVRGARDAAHFERVISLTTKK